MTTRINKAYSVRATGSEMTTSIELGLLVTDEYRAMPDDIRADDFILMLDQPGTMFAIGRVGPETVINSGRPVPMVAWEQVFVGLNDLQADLRAVLSDMSGTHIHQISLPLINKRLETVLKCGIDPGVIAGIREGNVRSVTPPSRCTERAFLANFPKTKLLDLAAAIFGSAGWSLRGTMQIGQSSRLMRFVRGQFGTGGQLIVHVNCDASRDPRPMHSEAITVLQAELSANPMAQAIIFSPPGVTTAYQSWISANCMRVQLWSDEEIVTNYAEITHNVSHSQLWPLYEAALEASGAVGRGETIA